MKRNEALPSQYLGKDDFPKPTRCIVDRVTVEEVKTEDSGKEKKPVMFFQKSSNPGLDMTRGMILNATNWDLMEEITGYDDSDNWNGADIIVYVDDSVKFGGKKVGGLRVKHVKAKPKPVEVEEPPDFQEDEPPPPSDEDLPF